MDDVDTPHAVSLDFATAFGAPEACPECGSTTMSADAVADRTYFRCEDCGSQWLFELGRVRRVATGEGVPGPR